LRLPRRIAVRVEPREHLAAIWLPWPEAAAKVFSWSNRQAIEMLPERARGT
jgi:dATP pyrophosphohydrolase